eukprot:5487440-Alexandrium_andersonii.AAC.1
MALRAARLTFSGRASAGVGAGGVAPCPQDGTASPMVKLFPDTVARDLAELARSEAAEQKTNKKKSAEGGASSASSSKRPAEKAAAP